jgi:SAM-dependent methyltransferase
MDASTIAAYDAHANDFAVRMRHVAPESIFAGLPGIFHPGAPTADIGCGSGRDVAWLRGLGYQVVGYDASEGMLRQARAAFPGINVRRDGLPELASIPDGAYTNVLCSAVLMHLPREDLITAAINLARILAPGGRLYLTYRGSRGVSEREEDGRLFTAIPVGKLVLLLESAGFQVLVQSTQPDSARPDVRWTAIAAEKSPLHVARGLDRIQRILAQDRKVATYKLALVRGLCAIGRTEPYVVRWGDEEVYVPLRSLAARWLAYYWPLVNGPDFIAQSRGEVPGSQKPIAFRATLQSLAERYGRDGLYAALRDLEEHPERLRASLRKIAETIRA